MTRSRPEEPERGYRLAGKGRRSWRGRASVSDGIAWESRNGAPAEKGSPRRPKPPHPSFVSPSPSVGSDGRRQGRAGSEGQRTALISAFFSSDQQAVRLARRPEATRSRPDEPERVVPRSGARLAETRSDVRARRPAVRRQVQPVSGQQNGRRVRGHRCESERSGGTEVVNHKLSGPAGKHPQL